MIKNIPYNSLVVDLNICETYGSFLLCLQLLQLLLKCVQLCVFLLKATDRAIISSINGTRSGCDVNSEERIINTYLSLSCSSSAALACWIRHDKCPYRQLCAFKYLITSEKSDWQSMSYLIVILFLFVLTGLEQRVDGGQLLYKLAFLCLCLLQLGSEGINLSGAFLDLSLQTPHTHLIFCRCKTALNVFPDIIR